MKRTVLKALVEKHEGRRPDPYKDTAGHLTIGVGRNLEDGLSNDEIDCLFDNDVTRVWNECSSKLAAFGFGALDDNRQHVLMDMCFNLGIGGLLRFSKMLAAVAARDFTAAAQEMLNSAWAREVGDRATELAAMMKGA